MVKTYQIFVNSVEKLLISVIELNWKVWLSENNLIFNKAVFVLTHDKNN